MLPKHAFESIRRLEGRAFDDEGNRLVPPPARDGSAVPVPFALLASFPYETPASPDPTRPLTRADLPEQLPDDVRSLDGRPVTLLGFMIPLELAPDGALRSFILTQNQMFCCFGEVPTMNEWVTVHVGPGMRARYRPNEPVGVRGTLAVGERLEDGFVTSLYRLDGTKQMTLEEVERSMSDPSKTR